MQNSSKSNHIKIMHIFDKALLLTLLCDLWLNFLHKFYYFLLTIATVDVIYTQGVADYERWLTYFSLRENQETKQNSIVKRAYARYICYVHISMHVNCLQLLQLCGTVYGDSW